MNVCQHTHPQGIQKGQKEESNKICNTHIYCPVTPQSFWPTRIVISHPFTKIQWCGTQRM